MWLCPYEMWLDYGFSDSKISCNVYTVFCNEKVSMKSVFLVFDELNALVVGISDCCSFDAIVFSTAVLGKHFYFENIYWCLIDADSLSCVLLDE